VDDATSGASLSCSDARRRAPKQAASRDLSLSREAFSKHQSDLHIALFKGHVTLTRNAFHQWGPNLAIGVGATCSFNTRSLCPAPLSLASSGPVPVKRSGSPGGLSRACARERCFHRLLQPTSVHEHPKPIRLPRAVLSLTRPNVTFASLVPNAFQRPTSGHDAVDAAPRASIPSAGPLPRSSFDPPPRRFRPRAESPSDL